MVETPRLQAKHIPRSRTATREIWNILRLKPKGLNDEYDFKLPPPEGGWFLQSTSSRPAFEPLDLKSREYSQYFYYNGRSLIVKNEPKDAMADRQDLPEDLISSNHGAMPLEYAPLVEPLFWGTGDLLVWDPADIADNIDREYLFRTVWAKECCSAEQYQTLRTARFLPLFEELSTLIEEKGLIRSRGFYGYFPVIADCSELVLLDPSDFHTELLSITFAPLTELHGRSITELFRPEGDVIACFAVTLGSELAAYRASGTGLEKQSYYFRGIASTLLETLEKKIVKEIRRGLGISKETGKYFSFPAAGRELHRLFEILSIEERLNVFLHEDGRLDPEDSSVGFYVRHPAAENVLNNDRLEKNDKNVA